ncbi:hypothetical protein F8M41_016828 [Gigaspora margarita]|uniref:Uncharacterized protein n=1 Tax=Gigaspora margarita TaxID=4874 RepID=A0A8H4AP54_GIGMA|nr:hypothetical protein F8M41_016828 [Gigaspora margarita]
MNNEVTTTSNTMESLSFVNNEVATSNTMKLLSFINEPTTLITNNNNDKVATIFHDNNEIVTTSNTIESLSFVNVEENGYGYDLYNLSIDPYEEPSLNLNYGVLKVYFKKLERKIKKIKI